MLERVRDCTKCKLCCNQRPLMDKCTRCQVLWVGLSAKKATCDDETPLSRSTNSGAINHKIDESLVGVSTYKTNLVMCLPLDDHQKLRYPNRQEIDDCFCNLEEEISTLAPKIVFLLGEKVYSSVAKRYRLSFERIDGFDYRYVKHDGVYYVPIHHPSYIHEYKRKQVDSYIHSIHRLTETLLNSEI